MHKTINDTITQHKIPIKSVIVGENIIDDAVQTIRQLYPNGNYIVVCDKITAVVAGNKIAGALGAFNLSLPAVVEAEGKYINIIKNEIKNADAVIAVGSGTINDLCKYASVSLNKPYVVFGTAPSMNGYSSANAAIAVNGHKKTLPAHLPEAVFMDLSILAKAPPMLIQSGLGDSICRPTAQADWLLSHLLFGTDYHEFPFAMLKPFEHNLLENSADLLSGNTEIMELLVNTLLISGFGMYLCKGSYPASQGEHMIAHTMEMVYGSEMSKTFHGQQIGVTALTMAKIQEEILSLSEEEFGCAVECRAEQFGREEVFSFFGEEIGSECIVEYEKKLARPLKNYNFDEIKEKIRAVSADYNYLKQVLSNAGCAIAPEELGWDKKHYKIAVKFAKYMRDRFTFLDIMQKI